MAKISKIARNDQRKAMVSKFAKRRAELKAIVKNMTLSDEERDAAQLKLQKMPRDASKVRIKNRCALTGRSRGFLRKFGISRIALREKALEGQIPGVVKSSW
jgi:small subunit ribosomal protein S14